MHLSKIPLFDWLIENMPRAKYDLANSSITGIKYEELMNFLDFEIPNDFNLGKNDPFGAMELREALAKIYNCNISNIISTTGGSEANFIVFLAMLNPGDRVIVEQPGYSPLWLVPEMLGTKVDFWHRRFEEGFKLDIEALKEKITNQTKLVIITNLHNPSGVLTTENEIKAVAEVVEENNAFLLIDEIFLDVANKPQNSASNLNSIIVTSSVSKVYGIGGLRTGWIVAADDVAKSCLKAKWQGTVASPYLSEIISASALANARDSLLQRCKDSAARNFPVVKDWIETHERILDWVEPDGGILCFPKFVINNDIDSVMLGKKFIDESGVLISPGKFFGNDDHFRLTYMNPVEELKFALDSMSVILKSISSVN
jgi:aspartate/methionine/tyrosine aminotransferase